MASRRRSRLRAPYLRTLTMLPDKIVEGEFPFTLPFATPDFRLELTHPVTMLVGENGTGKSTLLEAIAQLCGFNLEGGGRDNSYANQTKPDGLGAALKAVWLPRVGRGFFFRAESFFNFITDVHERWLEVDGVENPYGERHLHRMSHGEAMLSFFENRFGGGAPSIFLLDEPEAALSPQRQLEFLALLDRRRRSGMSQWIIATHSPILLAYPERDLLLFGHRGIARARYEETPHAQLFEAFARDPGGYLRRYIEEAG